MTAIGGTDLRPLGIGEILDAAVRVYRNNFKTLTIAVLVVVLPLSILDTLITASTTENAFDYSETAATEADGGFLAGQLVSTLISILLFSVATAACFHAVMRGYLGESATWQESLAFGLKRMLPVLLLGLLAMLGLIPMFLLLIIPGIWLAVRWSVAAPALLAEDLGPAAALGRSFKLVKGRWWPVFGALVAMTILITVLTMIVGLLLGAIFTSPDNELIVAIVYTLVIALAYAVTLPIQSAVFTILYFDLRVRKEGYDLQLAAGGLGDAPAAMPGEPSGGGGFSPPSEGGFAPPSGGGFAPPQAAPDSPRDTSGTVPPPGFGGGAIPTPLPATPPAEPPAPGASQPTPPPESEPEREREREREPATAAAPADTEPGGFNWNPSAGEEDAAPPPPGEETPPASR